MAVRPFAELAVQAGDATAPKEARIRAARELSDVLPGTKEPTLPVVREHRPKLMAAFSAETDPDLRAALAAALSALHRAAHGIYKPDELAQSNATRIYREKNPIANYAARERVIYPTTSSHREAILKTGNLPATK